MTRVHTCYVWEYSRTELLSRNIMNYQKAVYQTQYLIQFLPIRTIALVDSVDQPKIIRIDDPFNINDRDSINWKGRPLIVGKPIAVPFAGDLDDGPEPMFPHYRFRECRPIRFHFSTLCHDINNLFTCASMRTGLPRWFFLTLVLSISFLMIWLGIFTLSMLRRLRRREVSSYKQICLLLSLI